MKTPSLPYLLLFRDASPEAYKSVSAEQRQQLLVRWNQWYDQLASTGRLLHGHPLEPEGRIVSAPPGTGIVDGPFVEGKEAIGGYFFLTVESLDEATAIARGCPGLEFGVVVEVRPIADGCRLGKKTPDAVHSLAAARQ